MRARNWENKHSPRRLGYTMIEMVAGMAVMSAVMVGMGSAMLIASHALPSGSIQTHVTLAGADIAERLSGEFYCAEAFGGRTDRSVSFQVRDRDGDSISDTLSYSWSGTPGDPLLRQLNGNVPVAVIDNVHAFQLAYLMRTETTSSTSTEEVEGDEVLLAKFDGWSGILSSLLDFIPSTTSWAAEYFQIDQVPIPADVTKIRFTRMRLRLAGLGLGNLTAAIHQPSGSGNPVPQSSPLGTPTLILGSSLPLLSSWVNVDLTDDVALNSKSTEFVIVVKGSGLLAGQWSYLTSAAAPNDSSSIAVWTSNSGSSWNPKSSQRKENDFQFYVYGRLTVPTSITNDSSRYWLQGVAITLQSGSSTAGRVSTLARVLNEPEVLAP